MERIKVNEATLRNGNPLFIKERPNPFNRIPGEIIFDVNPSVTSLTVYLS
jgi:hypothetical protein